MIFTIIQALYSWTIEKPTRYEKVSLDKPIDLLSGPQRAISVIHGNSKAQSPSIVVNHCLSLNIDGRQFIPGATGYSFINPSDANTEDERLKKRLNKSMDSLEKLRHLLRGTTKSMATNSQQMSTEMTPMSTVEKECFISSPQISDEQKDIDMTQIYSKLFIRFSNGLTSAQFFNSHCSTIKTAHLNASSPTQFQHIDINTGICLFSKSLLLSSPGNGQSINVHDNFVVPPLPQNDKPTVYELEIIVRLSSAIADTVALIGSPHCKETPISINIDIPDFQYYWTACELLQHNLVSVEFAQKWIRRSLLRARQLPAVAITITPGTEAAVALVEESVALGIVPSLENILTALQTQGDDAARWKEFLYHLDQKSRPSTVGDLSRLIYVFKAVRPILKTHSNRYSDNINGRNLLIQVDDVNEWRILDNAKKFLKRYSKQVFDNSNEPISVGLFPIQKIFASGSGRSDLYLDDPTFNLCLDPEKTIIDPFDVIGTTYGLLMGGYMRRLCLQEGFR
ncbi:unnamed protein product [Penicillium pancosmium]